MRRRQRQRSKRWPRRTRWIWPRRCTPARPRGVVPPTAAPCLAGCCEAARTGSSTVAAAAARRQSAYRLRTSCTCGARRARRQRLGQTRSRGAPEDIVHLWSAPISDVASRVHAGARRAETTSRGWWREERHGAERRMACRDDARTCIRRGRGCDWRWEGCASQREGRRVWVARRAVGRGKGPLGGEYMTRSDPARATQDISMIPTPQARLAAAKKKAAAACN